LVRVTKDKEHIVQLFGNVIQKWNWRDNNSKTVKLNHNCKTLLREGAIVENDLLLQRTNQNQLCVWDLNTRECIQTLKDFDKDSYALKSNGILIVKTNRKIVFYARS